MFQVHVDVVRRILQCFEQWSVFSDAVTLLADDGVVKAVSAVMEYTSVSIPVRSADVQSTEKLPGGYLSFSDPLRNDDQLPRFDPSSPLSPISPATMTRRRPRRVDFPAHAQQLGPGRLSRLAGEWGSATSLSPRRHSEGPRPPAAAAAVSSKYETDSPVRSFAPLDSDGVTLDPCSPPPVAFGPIAAGTSRALSRSPQNSFSGVSLEQFGIRLTPNTETSPLAAQLIHVVLGNGPFPPFLPSALSDGREMEPWYLKKMQPCVSARRNNLHQLKLDSWGLRVFAKLLSHPNIRTSRRLGALISVEDGPTVAIMTATYLLAKHSPSLSLALSSQTVPIASIGVESPVCSAGDVAKPFAGGSGTTHRRLRASSVIANKSQFSLQDRTELELVHAVISTALNFGVILHPSLIVAASRPPLHFLEALCGFLLRLLQLHVQLSADACTFPPSPRARDAEAPEVCVDSVALVPVPSLFPQSFPDLIPRSVLSLAHALSLLRSMASLTKEPDVASTTYASTAYSVDDEKALNAPQSAAYHKDHQLLLDFLTTSATCILKRLYLSSIGKRNPSRDEINHVDLQNLYAVSASKPSSRTRAQSAQLSIGSSDVSRSMLQKLLQALSTFAEVCIATSRQPPSPTSQTSFEYSYGSSLASVLSSSKAIATASTLDSPAHAPSPSGPNESRQPHLARARSLNVEIAPTVSEGKSLEVSMRWAVRIRMFAFVK